MSEHNHRPDPGREAAVALILAAFPGSQHQKPRTCLGCGHTAPEGWYDCASDGLTLHAWCGACLAEQGNGTVWSYRVTWPTFWRLTTVPEGQLALDMTA